MIFFYQGRFEDAASAIHCHHILAASVLRNDNVGGKWFCEYCSLYISGCWLLKIGLTFYAVLIAWYYMEVYATRE